MNRTDIKSLKAYQFDKHSLEELENFIAYVREHTTTPSEDIHLDLVFDDEESYIVAWFSYEMTDEQIEEKRKKKIEMDEHSLKYHLSQVEFYKKQLEGNN